MSVAGMTDEARDGARLAGQPARIRDHVVDGRRRTLDDASEHRVSPSTLWHSGRWEYKLSSSQRGE